jgi:dihydrofolate reductase
MARRPPHVTQPRRARSQAVAVVLAQEAAGGRDVRIGGGPSTVRQFLQAGLVDFMHLVIVPITLGSGVSLWEGSSCLEDRFTIESVTSPSGLTHQLWNKDDHA